MLIKSRHLRVARKKRAHRKTLPVWIPHVTTEGHLSLKGKVEVNRCEYPGWRRRAAGLTSRAVHTAERHALRPRVLSARRQTIFGAKNPGLGSARRVARTPVVTLAPAQAQLFLQLSHE
ncbi:hypothetical protein RR48_09737 [Papilio machaon]|uniref:Uncharacterized protein n=1 Tax=Papilio machaon TaxID=76193 RepID=A0A194REB8_PAPMA|nr:hypothetical protein RR48_09737 [Papilio machaon]